jgi:hypothetical protein
MMHDPLEILKPLNSGDIRLGSKPYSGYEPPSNRPTPIRTFYTPLIGPFIKSSRNDILVVFRMFREMDFRIDMVEITT